MFKPVSPGPQSAPFHGIVEAHMWMSRGCCGWLLWTLSLLPRAGVSRHSGLLVAFALLTNGCASLTSPPGRESNLSYTPRGASGPSLADRPGEESPRPLASPSTSLHEPGRQSVTLTRQAVFGIVDDVQGTTVSVASALSKLAARPPGQGNRGLSGVNGAFTRYLDHGSNQLPWLHGALGRTTLLTNAASEVADSDMELGILRMTGAQLQAAMFGSMLLAAWLDFLQLADIVLRECPAYSTERLFMDMHRVQRLIEPTLSALASQDPEQVEAAAIEMPGLMGQLTREFGSIRDGARMAMERSGRLMAAAQLVEMLTLVSTLRMSLPRLPPAAPATLGVGLVMGSDGVMVGSQIAVSAEWVELIRRLVRAGVLSLPAVSAAVRIHGGQVMMAQANGELPEGVRDALGDSPEVRGMRVTGRAGAGMSRAPMHHVLPEEFRAWFEKRGFRGDMDIDKFCVRLEQAHHQAIHGGGNWRLGRTWPNEWNRMIMEALREAEVEVGRMLTRNEVLNIVASRMKRYDIPMKFIQGGRR
ncbi:DUF2380 domain-containing protein [Hyalangium minutum]|uniref:DUF2380 domain-containing protein n=1 Tax=Hyalangium minutum TaxID=394096 RepID=A0A085WPG9_9BACT|nr:DUF2380 domain-containing protein [Hyalangium minutum]KFE69582.1 hypothetical protein DB31_6557 [Hyalangium minutum]